MFPPLPSQPIEHTFSVMVQHGALKGSMNFVTTGGKATMKDMDEQHKLAMANLAKSHEEDLEKCKVNTMQSFQDYLPYLKSNFLLHAQMVGGLFDARKVNFDALSHLTNTQLDFDIRFSFGATWEEFVENWKNSSRL
ncbi:hypothetical protein J1N35_028692 [Gossypium stocksii]|uniref:Uncharacterized protein n=1 Tax=Gossypium stocksii TaxID=47602 RepID=A0A9D3UWI6_9ROSI|nr:hypothetical protein J1N35_028692 [Gossypium stocksii]